MTHSEHGTEDTKHHGYKTRVIYRKILWSYRRRLVRLCRRRLPWIVRRWRHALILSFCEYFGALCFRFGFNQSKSGKLKVNYRLTPLYLEELHLAPKLLKTLLSHNRWMLKTFLPWSFFNEYYFSITWMFILNIMFTFSNVIKM